MTERACACDYSPSA